MSELNDFDMVWAITQGTINSQLQWLFTKLTPPGQQGISYVSFGQLYQEGTTTIKDGMHVEGYLGTPSIEIDQGNDGTVLLYIPFTSGTLQHLGFGSAAVYSVDLTPDPNNPDTTTWKLCFKCNLNINDITKSLDCSAQSPPANMHQETFNKLCHFASSDFTIRQIFLDLQNVDMVTYMPNQSTMPANPIATLTSNGTTQTNQPDPMASTALSNLMPMYFKELDANSASNPYILGYTANANFDDVSAFQPTDTVYSTHYYTPSESQTGTWMPGTIVKVSMADAASPTDQSGSDDLSTFNFLLTTHHKTPPTVNLGFNYNLVTETGISGTGRVANTTVVSDWLASSALSNGCVIGVIADAAGVLMSDLSYDATTYQWTGSHTQQVDDQKIAWATAKVTTINSVTIKFSASETDSSGVTGPGLAISGSFASRFDFNTGLCKGHYTRTQPYSMSIVMQPGIGNDGNATVTLSRSAVTTGDASDNSDLGGLCKIPGLKQAIEAIVEDMIKDPLQKMDTMEVSAFGSIMNNALGTLSSQIILPAPSIFAYKNLSFNDEFDLVTDFNYSTQDQ